MKVKSLAGALKLVSRISNPSSLNSIYKSVEIKESSIHAISEYGNIHIQLPEETGLTSSLLDAQAVLTVFSSLPQDEDITLKEKGNHLSWECDNIKVKGKLNYVVTPHSVPDILHDQFTWQPTADFANALYLASSACQAAAVSFGLYGVTMQPVDDKLHMMSSNTISLAATQVDKGTFPDRIVTLRPPVPGIIAVILGAYPTASIDVCDQGIFIQGDGIRVHLPLGVNLDHDLKKLVDKFQKQDKVLTIDTAAVKKFIMRARNMTEKQVSFTVSMKIEGGKLILEHKGIASSTEQYFLAEGIDPAVNYATVALSADLLIEPLGSVDRIICDYLGEKHLVLRGSQPEFLYVVGGS